MAVATAETTRANPVVRWVFGCPLWQLIGAAFAVAFLRFGYHETDGLGYHLYVMADPFTKRKGVPGWLYESPLEPLLGWALHVDSLATLRLLHLTVAIGLLVGCTYVVATKVSDLAGRLFLFAWFCSYQVWGWLAQVGVIGDMINIAALTAAMVVTAPAAALAVGVLLGFNHFEQAVFAMAAVIIARRWVLDDRNVPIVPIVAGLIVGKIINLTYLAVADLPTMGRIEFIRAVGARNLVDGWRGQLPALIFSCYHVAWLAIVWMWTHVDRRRAVILVALQCALTIPVLLTYDLTRVYSILTWPLLMCCVIWFSRQPDRAGVQRAALWLAVAAWIVPTSNVWHATGAGIEQFFR